MVAETLRCDDEALIALAAGRPASVPMRQDQIHEEVRLMQKIGQKAVDDASEFINELHGMAVGQPRTPQQTLRPMSAAESQVLPSSIKGNVTRHVHDGDWRRRGRGIQKLEGITMNHGEEHATLDSPASGDALRAEETMDHTAILVCFADFDPPTSETTQVLPLRIGDEVTPIGLDDGGWWFGRKLADGTEGWFPPSYMQLKHEQ